MSKNKSLWYTRPLFVASALVVIVALGYFVFQPKNLVSQIAPAQIDVITTSSDEAAVDQNSDIDAVATAGKSTLLYTYDFSTLSPRTSPGNYAIKYSPCTFYLGCAEITIPPTTTEIAAIDLPYDYPTSQITRTTVDFYKASGTAQGVWTKLWLNVTSSGHYRFSILAADQALEVARILSGSPDKVYYSKNKIAVINPAGGNILSVTRNPMTGATSVRVNGTPIFSFIDKSLVGGHPVIAVDSYNPKVIKFNFHSFVVEGL